MVVFTYNPSCREVEEGGFQVQGQPGLHSKTEKNKKKKLIWRKIYIL
jgi:hypothetical protein